MNFLKPVKTNFAFVMVFNWPYNKSNFKNYANMFFITHTSSSRRHLFETKWESFRGRQTQISHTADIPFQTENTVSIIHYNHHAVLHYSL